MDNQCGPVGIPPVNDVAEVNPHEDGTYRFNLRLPEMQQHERNHLYEYTQFLEFIL